MIDRTLPCRQLPLSTTHTSQHSLPKDVSTRDRPDKWFYLGALRSVILNNDDYIVKDDLDFDGDFSFLINNMQGIIVALNKENYPVTKVGYEKVLQRRSDRVFGPIKLLIGLRKAPNSVFFKLWLDVGAFDYKSLLSFVVA